MRRSSFRFPRGCPDCCASTLQAGADADRQARFCAVFPDRPRHRRLRAQLDPPILCQGRGSAANSAVCYCLGITAVDPTSDLLFERFISEERKEPPDIDVDFEHERREEVIQHIYQNTAATAPGSPRP